MIEYGRDTSHVIVSTPLQQIWGESYAGFDRTIDNHITRLRKKLGPSGEKTETVRGIGYRFKAD